MKRIILSSILISAFLLFSGLANAYSFMTTTSNGTQKVSFLTNETMFILADNITNASASVNIYLINHNASLANQTVLTGTVLGPVTITTNSTGGFDFRSFWSPNLIAGTYDLIADVNRNNIFDLGNCGNGGDCNYSAGGGGIVVTRAPIPTLAFSVGPKSPAAHTYSYDSNSPNNLMLQIKIVGDQVEAVVITTFDFVPSGTGHDKTGISVVKMFDDSNGNGIIDLGEPLLGYGQYLSDDGVLRLDLASSPYTVRSNTTVYLLVQYTMTNLISSGQTFSTQLVSITANGQNTQQKAVVSGIPITSAVKTISGAVTTTSTSATTSATTTTTVLPKDECSIDSDCGSSSCSNGNQITPACKSDPQKGIKVCSSTTTSVSCCPGEKCGGIDLNIWLLVLAAIVAFMVPAIYFFFIKKPAPQPELYRGP